MGQVIGGSDRLLAQLTRLRRLAGLALVILAALRPSRGRKLQLSPGAEAPVLPGRSTMSHV
jgi:hypothetical protein